jgi:hypothetical protein
VVVTGTFEGRPVRYASRVSLQDAEQGNSFIPRLWARMHLDYLLAQGASQAIQDEIIALSEEYHIMTPYTSLLVLETDADRERFKVKRRFLMRDAERMFADAREKVNYDLVQQQMKRAGLWRLGLRRTVLAQLAGLGRDAHLFARQVLGVATHAGSGRIGGVGGGGFVPGAGDYSGRLWDLDGKEDGFTLGDRVNGPVGADMPMSTSGGDAYSLDLGQKAQLDLEGAERGNRLVASAEERSRESLDADYDVREGVAASEARQPLGEPRDEAADYGPVDFSVGFSRGSVLMPSAAPARPMSGLAWEGESLARWDRRSGRGGGGLGMGWAEFSEDGAFSLKKELKSARYLGGYYAYAWSGSQGLDSLFPSVPPTPVKTAPPKPKKPWPAEAKAIADSLLRTEALRKLPGGLRIERIAESYEARRNELTSRTTALALFSPQAWLTRSEGVSQQRLVHWCDGKERGALALGFQLGRVRAAQPADLDPTTIGLGLDGYVLTPLDQSYRDHDVQIERPAPERVLLRIVYPQSRGYETRYLIDTARRVVLSVESRQDGKTTATTRHDEFVEVAGAWWATRSETVDAKGRRTSLTTLKLATLPVGDLTAAIRQQLAGREQVQFLHEPLPRLVDAKRALAAGKATFDDRVVLMLHFGQAQQWTRVQEHLAQAEELAAGKPGVRWVHNAILNASRRREELRTRIMDEAARMAKAAGADELFLANHLVSQSSGILEANEMLRLLDALRPVFERQPAFSRAMRSFEEQRINYLQQTGQTQQALQLLGPLADRYRHDHSLQERHANTLAQAGEHDAAYRRLRECLDGKIEWLPYEETSLRNTWCQLLQGQGQWAAAAELLTQWLKSNPEDFSTYERYLSVLVRLDKEDQAATLAAAWLKEGQIPGKLAPAASARLDAAVRFMLGNYGYVHLQRLEERWLSPLADAALFFARHEFHGATADTIMNDWRFTQTDACRRVRRTARQILEQEIEKLPPEQLPRLVRWVSANDPAVEQQDWRKLAVRLRQRWAAEKDVDRKRVLAGPLTDIYSGKLTPDERLDFFRDRLRQAPAEERTVCTQQIFDTLLSLPWSAAREHEALGLLDKLSDAPEAVDRLLAQLPALHRFTDQMAEARYQQAIQAVEHPENLTRDKLREKQAELRNQARLGLAERLRKEVSRHEGPLGKWMTAERLYLVVRGGFVAPTAIGEDRLQAARRAEDECWELLGPAPKPVAEDDPLAAIDEALRGRMLVMLANFAARKGAAPQTAERLLAYVEARMAQAGVDGLRWKAIKYQLLVALDRPQPLEQSLRTWITADGPINRWRLSLGYLLAERGKLTDAIPLFEAVAANDELGPAEYRTLADWYMAANRRTDYDRALINAYKAIEEWQLRNLLDRRLRPWQQRSGRVPSELDKEVLLVFAALFEKSGQPQNHVGLVQQFYRETRDFRLLEGLADAVVGHTAGKVYPFLQSLSSVLSEVRDEATADAIVEHLSKVRQRAKTAVDQRALDLLEALVERRAAEVLNRPGPHVDKALAALRRAFQREWTPGEPRLMADLLASLGQITQEKLAAEQVRQLDTLYQQAAQAWRGSPDPAETPDRRVSGESGRPPVGSVARSGDRPQPEIDRLHIALRLANAHWSYNRRDAAIDLLQLELREFERAQGGRLPQEANDALSTFVGYLESRGHHARGEQTLFDRLQRPANAQQKLWFTRRLYELYDHAIRDDAEVSLGKGATLYRAAAGKIEADLATSDPNHRSELLNRLCSVYRTAHHRKLPSVADDLRAFAFRRFMPIVKRDLNNYSSLVSSLAHTVRDICGPRDGLAVLIEQFEQ